MLETYVDDSVGAKVRMLCRGCRLLVRGARQLAWREELCIGVERGGVCSCGAVETVENLVLECVKMKKLRETWIGEVCAGGQMMGMLVGCQWVEGRPLYKRYIMGLV